MPYPHAFPPPHGLYDPRFEHDACGVAFVSTLTGEASHDIVLKALTALRNLDHRGAAGAETNSGDGAGILLQVPDAFLREVTRESGFELPPAGTYAVGTAFLPGDDDAVAKTRQRIEEIADEEGLEVLGWRDVPINPDVLGATAHGAMPSFAQVFVAGSGARVAIAQRAVACGENETLAARALLETLALDGLLVSGDAMHAHDGTAQVILDRGGDYLLALKANRPAMLREVEAFFADPPEPLDAFETTDADHGRIETRRHRVTPSVDWLFSDRRYAGEPRLPGLATLACVEASRTEAGRTSVSTRYYLSSARLTPQAFAHAVRAHWAIENGLHWVLDVTFDEDRARNRRDNGPENLAILRRLTLNLLNKARPKMSAARKRKRAGWSDAFARTIIGQMR